MALDLVTRAESTGPAFVLELDDFTSPTLAVALHDGARLRPEVAERLALEERVRRREEDPFSGVWAGISPNRIVVLRSRFEVDLNRPPERSVYVEPEDSWGLSIWASPPDAGLLARSYEEHARFYATVKGVLDRLVQRHGRVLVLDLHSYNHRRGGAHAPPADPSDNPALNVGTGSMPRARWAHVVDAFMDAAASCRLDGQAVDVRENVRFFGGYFPTWVHRTYPTSACALALEVKKTFMDEWTGRVDVGRLWAWREILQLGVNAARRALESS